ncbi:tape measure protein [Methyloversatilis universalis]|uniref:tape measure protein n=1 Tax=Methyloversatilis universalis TaxID=378211 RepID=UPI00037C9543|nr:tape measure protein [Methyloversatilis universalis]
MTANTATLALRIDASQATSAATALHRFEQSGKNAETSANRLASATTSLRNVFAGLSTAVAVRNFVQLADTYSNINSRLKLVTQSAGEFVAAQEALFDISQRTRVGLEQTSDLYGNLRRSTQSLGVSQSEVLGVTETINKALIVSGTSAQGAAAALVQLGQGFASGTLRGEELNSVLEQAPRLAQAIADGLGVPIGKLRELTGARVFEAIRKSGEQVGKEFDSMAKTVEQASTQGANSLLKLIGKLDEATGASASLAKTISESAVFMGTLGDEISRGAAGQKDIGLLAEAFLVVEETVKVLAANISFVFKSIGREIGAIAAQAEALSRLDFSGFSAIGDAVKADAAEARRALDQYEKDVLSRTRAKPAATTPVAASATPRAAAGTFTARGGSRRKGSDDSERMLREAEAMVDEWSPLKLRWELEDSFESRDTNAALADWKAESEERRDAMVRTYQDIADPARRYREEVQLVNALEAQALLTGEEAFAVRSKLYEDMDRATGEVNEKLREQRGIGEELGLTFSSAFEDAILRGRELSDVFAGLAEDVARIAIRKSITEPLGEAVAAAFSAKGGGGGGFGGIFSAITSFLGFADGGYVRGPGSATSDSIPARLSNGEYVIRAEAVRKVGVATLDAINTGGPIRKYAAGGYVGQASGAAGAPARDGLVVNITNQTPAEVTTTRGEDGSLNVLIRAVAAQMADDVGAGVGPLNAALHGRFGLRPQTGGY